MEDFLCACALAMGALDFSVGAICKQKDFMHKKENVGRGEWGLFC